MTINPTTLNLNEFLASLPQRGFSVSQVSPTRWDVLDAYGDGSTDFTVLLEHVVGRGDTYRTVPFGQTS